MADSLDIKLIRTDGGTQPRAQINQETVNDYAADMGNGATFPPVVVFYDGTDYWLADGFHRVSAARSLGLLDIESDIRPGTRRDAILYAVGANAGHGLRRTNEDKRRAVMTLMDDEEWAKWSDNRIAKACGVSQPFVSSLRASLITLISEPRTYTTKHGTTATMQTANIGQRAQAPTPQYEPEPDYTPSFIPAPAIPAPAIAAAPPVYRPEPAEQVKAINRAYITLDDWQSMTPTLRSTALATTGGTSRMNQQDTDNIEWAKWSWNPVTGCRHNCSYCYARDIAMRFYEQGFEPAFLPSRLSMPRNTPVPAAATQDIGFKNVFTCSMADLFGRWVPREWIGAILQTVADNPQWNFLFLTKFPIRLSEFEFPANAWLGTTVDAQARVANAERAMSKVKGGIKWLSCEPMLEPLRFTTLEMFDWVVIGGASKSTQTPGFHPPREWVEDLEGQARRAGCKVYEKSNLLDRIKEYPGQADAQPVNVPDEFKMTYLQRDVLKPSEYQREFA